MFAVRGWPAELGDEDECNFSASILYIRFSFNLIKTKSSHYYKTRRLILFSSDNKSVCPTKIGVMKVWGTRITGV